MRSPLLSLVVSLRAWHALCQSHAQPVAETGDEMCHAQRIWPEVGGRP